MESELSGWYVTANDIIKWTETNKRRSEEILPLLVQKLILFSCKPKEIDFPSGDLVQIGGWDGILDLEEGTQFIPSGKSGWEFGTDSNVNKKANGDYYKRTNNPKPIRRRESTFVFVTSRLWTKKKFWVNEKKKERKWKDVKGINAEDLEAWLAQCPPVHRWFASILGKRNDRLWDLDLAWEALSHVTSCQLSIDLFCNSRNNEKNKLIENLSGKSSILRVKAQSKIESYGFILASLKMDPNHASKVLIVKDQSAWDWLLDFDKSLILIPEGFTPKALGRAVALGHYVIEPLSNQDAVPEDIHLDRMPRQERINALISMGLSEQQAQQIYSDTNGYLEPILRHSKLGPLDRIPVTWGSKVASDVLFAAFFATEWDENNDHDKEAISSLAGIDYKDFEKTIIELSKEPDPPVRLLGNIWQVISKVDMWLHIAPRLSKLHLDRLGIVVKQLMADSDPSFDLNVEERYMASIKGAIPLYSSRLKSGIADSLALLATYGDGYLNETNLKPSEYVHIWVRQMFDTANDAKAWYSLGRNLSSLAEAAPEEFLSAVENMTKGETLPILGLFESEGNGIFGGCLHADLLWSLERVSWDKSYLASVASVLARLSEIDPGGRYRNRPFRSLVDIFLGWINNTQATHHERLQVIEDVLLDRYPKITWKLLLALLPQNTQFTSGINKPTYRDWAIETDRSILLREYHLYISAVIELLFREVDKDFGERLIDLLDNFGKYDAQHQKALIQRLQNIKIETLTLSDREKITNKVRELISRHREFSGGDRSADENAIAQLENVYNRFELDDSVMKNLYLFNDYLPDLIHPLNRKDSDYKQKEELITNTRISAIENVIDEKGFDGVEKLAHQSIYPALIGYALHKSKYSSEAQKRIVEWIGRNDDKLLELVRTYISSKQDGTWIYVEKLLNENSNWSVNIKTNLLLALPADKRTFTIVDKFSNEIQKDYWSRLYNYAFFFKKAVEAQYVSQKFLENDRPLAALGAISQYLESGGVDKLDSNLVANILKRIISAPSDIDGPMRPEIHHNLSTAIRFIENSQELSEDEIAQIEWAFLPVFRYDEFLPNCLSKKVVRDASFFAQLVAWAFRSEGDKKADKPLDEPTRTRAEIASDLLRKIAIIPGDSGGVINADALNQWVDMARKLLQEADRVKIGDDQIGSYLSHSPVGSDGIWPHEAVRSVIERIKSKELDIALLVGRNNARGMTSRSPFDGGEQERVLAADYFQDAEKIELVYPRTAEILRKIGQGYERDARREDWEAELRD